MSFDKQYFEKVFAKAGPWGYSISQYEKTKYLRQLEAMKQYSSQPENILEVGCAEGVHTTLIAQTFPGAKILGVDISHIAIERAKKNCNGCGNVELIEADIIELIKQGKLPRNTFDIIIQSESLYYMFLNFVFHRSLGSYFRGLTSILKIDGIFVTSNGINILTRYAMKICYLMMKNFSVSVFSAEYREWNEFRHKHVRYDLRVFRKHR